jgi:hypothetical protein
MNYDAYGNPIKPKSSGVVVPLLLALLLSAGGNYWLWKERSKVSGDLFTATAKLAATEAVQKETAEKLATLETERASLIEAKDQAVKDAQARALELARLKDDVAGVLPKEPDAVAGADKTDNKDEAKPDAKAAKKEDAKADAKAETKADKKAKAKAKKKAAASGHKSKKGSDDDSTPAPAREL